LALGSRRVAARLAQAGHCAGRITIPVHGTRMKPADDHLEGLISA